MAKTFYRPSDVGDKVLSSRHTTFEKGISTGFKTLDEIISFKVGYHTLLFSSPHVGKSILTLDILLGIAEREQRTIAIYSPEFRTREEMVSSLIQQRIGKTLYGEYKQEVTDEEFIEATKFIDKFFILLERPPKTKENLLAGATITDIFKMCKEAQDEYKVKIDILFIDPANYVSRSSEEARMQTADYVLHLHDTIAEFSKLMKLHTILSSHCRDVEMLTDKDTNVKFYPIVFASDILGGQSNFRAGSMLVSLWRPPAGVMDKSTGYPYPENALDVICMKAKPMGSSKLGTRRIYFNRATHKLEEEIGNKRYAVNEYDNPKPKQQEIKPNYGFDDNIQF